MPFHPNGKFQFYWNTAYILSALYSAIVISLELVFHHHRPQWVQSLDLFIMAFFISDMFVRTKFAYFDSAILVQDSKLIKSKYLKSYFLFDLLCTIPIEWLIPDWNPEGGMDTHWHIIFYTMVTLRVARAMRVLTIFKRQSDLLDKAITVSILQYIIVSAIISHAITCGWIILYPEGAGEDNVTTYNLSLYWTITTLTTVGYGDISPTDNIGRIYTMFVMILGVAMYGVIIGNISSLLVQVDSFRQAQKSKMENLMAYMKHHFVPLDLQTEVISFYSKHLKLSTGQQEDSSLEGLPAALRDQLEFYANLKLINAVPMFKSASMECKRDLSQSLESMVVAPNHNIINFGEIGNEMYFVSHGQVEVLTENDDLLATLDNGSFFGETALLKEVKRTAAVKSSSYCSLLKLCKSDFLKLLNRHKDLEQQIRQINEKR
jgi:voltage-gated potassium channel